MLRRNDPWRRSGLSSPRADTSDDHVILVDHIDRAIGTMPKLAAHQIGRCHRAVSVIVRDSRGQLLLQQRAYGKYHSAGLWTNTCCSHPRPNEDDRDAAVRRLAEEMGLSAPLTRLFSMRYLAPVSPQLIENEYVHVFGGISNGVPNPDSFEVAAWYWKPFADVVRDVEQRPHAYTVWFTMMVREFSAELAAFVAR